MSFTQDVRHSFRSLRRTPGSTTLALLTLALGIGASTTIFSVVDAVLLRPLPFGQPQRLVQVWGGKPDRGWARSSLSHANFWDLRAWNQSFDDVGAIEWTTLNLTGDRYPEQIDAARVTAGFFSLLRVTPVAGRVFAADEDSPAHNTRVALLSHRLWVARFGSDRAIVGRTLTLDGEAYTVVGVLPRGTPWLDAADLFVPLVHDANPQRGSFEIMAIGRVKDGLSFDQARTDLQRVAAQLGERFPDVNKGFAFDIGPATEWIASDTLRRTLWVLAAAVAVLLLIACTNLANLLLVKAAGRTRETALRMALGASRFRVARLMLTESLLLSLAGALLGLACATWTIELLARLRVRGVPRLAEVEVNGWVLGFTIFAALATSVAIGLLPALQAPRRAIVPSLRDGERSVAGSPRQRRLRSILVGAEVALSLMLLAGAGLLVRSFDALLRVDRGFQTSKRLLVEVNLPSAYEKSRERMGQFMTDFLDRAGALPGVISLAAVSGRPLSQGSTGMGIAAAGTPDTAGDVPWATWRLVTSDYFKTMGVPLIAGRTFTPQDLAGKPWRVIVSKRVADLLWPGQDPIGRQAILWKGQGNTPADVIGVVGDMRERGLQAGPTLATYLPYYGAGFTPVQVVLHTSGDTDTLVSQLRATLTSIDPALPLANARTLDEIVSGSLGSRRFTLILMSVFAAMALLLALLGVYGVLTYVVARQTAEIGIRVALGASREHVLRTVVSQGMRPVLIGVVIGLAGALVVSRFMTSLLFDVTASDALTHVGVALLLSAAAAIACLLPARQALRIDVMSALRSE